jgi:hypothetical protein
MTGPLCIGDPSLSPTPLISCYLKNQTRLSNPDQLLLQDLSDSSAADRGEYRQAAGAIAGLNAVQCTLVIDPQTNQIKSTNRSQCGRHKNKSSPSFHLQQKCWL